MNKALTYKPAKEHGAVCAPRGASGIRLPVNRRISMDPVLATGYSQLTPERRFHEPPEGLGSTSDKRASGAAPRAFEKNSRRR